jgi:hypothetical protein
VAHSWPKRRLDDWLNQAEASRPPRGKRLQMSLFGGVRRRPSYCLNRPVTPEVAGSSPVAPAKVPANRQVVLSQQTPDLRRLHRPFRGKTRNGQKTARNPVARCRVQAGLAALRLSAGAACNYTKRPEVTAAPRAVDGSVCQKTLQRRGKHGSHLAMGAALTAPIKADVARSRATNTPPGPMPRSGGSPTGGHEEGRMNLCSGGPGGAGVICCIR